MATPDSTYWQRTLKSSFVILAVTTLIFMVGVLRLPVAEAREFMTALVRIAGIILVSIMLWKHSNKWIALFILSTLIPQFYLSKQQELIQLGDALFFPDIDTFITSINVVFGCLWYYFLTVEVDNTRANDNALMGTIAVIALVSVFVMLINKNSMGLVTNPNEASALLALSAPAFFKKKWWMLFPVVLYGLVLTNSCVGAAGVFVGVVVYSALSVSSSYTILVFILSVAVVLSYIKWVDTPSFSVRLQVWKALLREYVKQWFWGFEFGGLKWVTLRIEKFRKIDGGKNISIWWYTSNNEFLHILCEKGILFVCVVFGFLIDAFRKAKTLENKIPLTALMVLITISCFTYVFHNGVTAVFAIIWLSLIERQHRRMAA